VAERHELTKEEMMKLPIEVVPPAPGALPGLPLYFRWRTWFKPPFAEARWVEMGGHLSPQHADAAVADLVRIAEELAADNERLKQENERLLAENQELYERLGEREEVTRDVG
jgi:hypothetical protein